jgi:hypothetical protein
MFLSRMESGFALRLGRVATLPIVIPEGPRAAQSPRMCPQLVVVVRGRSVMYALGTE